MYVTYAELFQLLSLLVDVALLTVTVVVLICQNKKK